MLEWSVTFVGRDEVEYVRAHRWEVSQSGDLIFSQDTGGKPLHLRGFAAGTWQEVSLYA